MPSSVRLFITFDENECIYMSRDLMPAVMRAIGETSCHLSTRIKEHTTSCKHSHIFKHLAPPLNVNLAFAFLAFAS